ncbi:hypothetical protein BIW22_24795 [Salmonella enterica]|nr:hypothetical protein [Salmonella enterica]
MSFNTNQMHFQPVGFVPVFVGRHSGKVIPEVQATPGKDHLFSVPQHHYRSEGYFFPDKLHQGLPCILDSAPKPGSEAISLLKALTLKCALQEAERSLKFCENYILMKGSQLAANYSEMASEFKKDIFTKVDGIRTMEDFTKVARIYLS